MGVVITIRANASRALAVKRWCRSSWQHHSDHISENGVRLVESRVRPEPTCFFRVAFHRMNTGRVTRGQTRSSRSLSRASPTSSGRSILLRSKKPALHESAGARIIFRAPRGAPRLARGARGERSHTGTRKSENPLENTTEQFSENPPQR